MTHQEAELVHKAIQKKLAILRSEKDNMGELHPFHHYQLLMLESIDQHYDYGEDLETMKLALLELTKLFTI